MPGIVLAQVNQTGSPVICQSWPFEPDQDLQRKMVVVSQPVYVNPGL